MPKKEPHTFDILAGAPGIDYTPGTFLVERGEYGYLKFVFYNEEWQGNTPDIVMTRETALAMIRDILAQYRLKSPEPDATTV